MILRRAYGLHAAGNSQCRGRDDKRQYITVWRALAAPADARNLEGQKSTMLAFVSALIIVGSLPVPAVSPFEAAATAQWFCRSMEVNPSWRLCSVQLDTNTKTWVGAPLYEVQFKPSDRSDTLAVYVDGISGDVVHARFFGPPSSGAADTTTQGVAGTQDARRADKLMRRLGRSRELVPHPDNSVNDRYDVQIGGYPFFNLNGYTYVMLDLRGSAFAYFIGIGDTPPAPTAKPSVTAARAVEAAVAQRKKTVPVWPQPLEVRTQLGLLFDEKTQSTVWVWKVVEGFVSSGKFYDSFTNYVNAETGEAVADNDIQWSRFMYRSRAPRTGLSLVKPLRLHIPLLAAADRKMKELGRTDVRFEGFDLDDGVRLTAGTDVELVVDSHGDLKSFRAGPSDQKQDGKPALERGGAIMLAEQRKLPEGKIMADKFFDQNRVVYRERALGYDYLNSDLATVGFGAYGEVTSYAAASRPRGPQPSQTRS